MLKLFRLKVVPDIIDILRDSPVEDRTYFFWYTEPTECIVLAESKEEARKLAWEEDRDYIFWKYPQLVTIEEIPMDKAYVLLTQCGTG